MASWLASIVKELGNWVGAAAVQKLVDMGMESHLSKHRQPVDNKAALKRVETALPKIKAVMGVADALKMKDPSTHTRNWVQQFRDAVDAAEDVLDELKYKELENMVQKQNRGDPVGEGSSSVSKKRKTCAISGDILERLEEAVAMLDEATVGLEELHQRAKELGIHYLSESQLEVRTNLTRETTSFLSERKVFGRDAEKAQIISWLKRGTEAPLSSFGIVGVGGLGKTTLAQSVYQELSRTGYFQQTIWVCVSTEFSVKVITVKILGELGEECKDDNPLNILQQRLEAKIQSKKILLILDDVWEDKKMGDWEQLIAPLRCAQQGSKILFTTRQKSVADLLARVISIEHESLPLKDLKEQELRLLFNSYAFYPFNPDEYGDLQAIGDQIVKKLHGSPLAAKVIGSLLNSHMDPYFWRRISSHNSLINSQQAIDVMEVLKLSYYNLPGDLQVCFRFCSIFSQDHDFFKEDLIKMWMASGFLRQQSWEGKRPEDIGEDYFNILLRKSFFEVSKIKEQGYYVMHDLIHELATNVSEGECCRVGHNDKSIYIPSTVRHVSVHESQIQKVSHLKNIRSLVITTIGEQQDKTVPKCFVLPNNLVKKNLRLLKIHANRCCKLQEEVSYLVHLRYLSIYIPYPLFQHIIHAPIYKLYHLLVLEVIGSEDSEIETTGMANLVNLRYMRLPNLIIKTICGVHKMTSLHELTFFVGPESGHRINELRTLNNLRSLDIYNIENIRDPSEAASANLLGKENLQSLELIYTPHETNLNNPEQILDNLQPHQNLMELAIRGYKGQRSPMWMMGEVPLLNLSTLKLNQCLYLNNLSSFGQMTSLKELEIYNCPNMDKLPDMPLSLTKFRVHDVGLTALPGLSVHTSITSRQKSFLRFVYISRCPNLITLNGFLQQDTVELHGLEDLGITNCENLAQLPLHAFTTCVSLKNLFIEDCPNLTWLPCLPLSLITFKIDGIGASTLPEYFHSSGSNGGSSPSSFIASSIEKIDIWNCPNLISLNGFLEQENIEFWAINEFWVVNCESLIQIPKGGFSKFVSVNYLDIRDCPKLEAVDNQNTLLPSKLRELCMNNCGELDAPLLESSSRLTTLTQLAIFNSSNITRIPSTENVFGSLSKLQIENCPKLIEIELSLMRPAHNVDRGSNFASLKIDYLSIDELALLLIEPLRSLRSVSKLFVSCCLTIDAQRVEQWLLQNSTTLRELTIWNASTLRSLPATMARLTSLEHLRIERADLLVELPELPASLKIREIKSSDGADKF